MSQTALSKAEEAAAGSSGVDADGYNKHDVGSATPLMSSGVAGERVPAKAASPYIQMRGVVRRMAAVQSRSSCSNCCQICCPMTLVVLVGILQIFFMRLIAQNPDALSPPANYTASIYAPELLIPTNLREHYLSPNGTKLPETYCQQNNLRQWRALYGKESGVKTGTLEADGSGSGFLGLVPQIEIANYDLPVPYFTPSKGDGSEASIDGELNKAINAAQKESQGKHAGETNYPMGGIYFQDINTKKDKLSLSYIGEFLTADFFGAGQYLSVYSRLSSSDGSPFGAFISALNSAVLNAAHVDDDDAPELQIIASYRESPSVSNSAFSFNICISCAVGSLFFPFALSMMYPLFVYTIVQEKESRSREMMKMMGMRTRWYWLALYAFFTILGTAVWVVFCMVAGAFRIPLVAKTNVLVFVILFVLWTHSLIVFCFFLSTFFSRSRVAFVIVFFLMLAGVIGSLAVNAAKYATQTASVWYLIYPPFAFYYGLNLMNAPLVSNSVPLGLRDIAPGTPMAKVYVTLFLSSLVFGFLTYYLDEVLPKQYGVRKSPLFPCTDAYEYCTSASVDRSYSSLGEIEAVDEGALALIRDEDVRREAFAVLNDQQHHTPADAAVVTKNIVKVYGSGSSAKLACAGVTLAIRQGEVFGLLGSNGAGKTTLISMLTGLFMPTSGDGYINGLSIKTQMDVIRRSIGVCPQHDILFEKLTVREHLLLYARLKGVSPADEHAQVERLLLEVGLTDCADRYASTLSGGMKRRLSVAIAFVGDAKVVFLDEPTTGLDPENRRHLWGVIQRARRNCAVILTTHSMEEADVLSTRLAIMSHGTLQCIGTQTHLKNKFGEGFKLDITSDLENKHVAEDFIMSLVPNAEVESSFGAATSFKFERSEVVAGDLYDAIEAGKEAHFIKEWSMSQTSLEEVFVNIVRVDEARFEAEQAGHV